MSPERRKELNSRGGKSVSQHQRNKQKLRQIRERVKKGQLTTQDERWLLERVTKKESMQLDILDWFDELRKDTVNEKVRVSLLNTYNQILKSVHGEKLDIKADVNVDVNFYSTLMGKYKERSIDGVEVKDIEDTQ